MSHYDTLEVSPRASDAVIRASYKTLIQRFHPDRHTPREEAEEICKRLNAAYAVLSDPGRRQEYDHELERQEGLAENRSGRAERGFYEQPERASPDSEADRSAGRAEQARYQRESSYTSQQGSGWASPPPTERFESWLRRPMPWRRFFAKVMDQFIYMVLTITTIVLLYRSGKLSAGTLNNQGLVAVVLLCAMPVFEGIVLQLSGTSPGRWLCGLRVSDREGTPISSEAAWRRTFHMWAAGTGFGIPIIALVTYILGYHRLTQQGITSWDEANGLMVTGRPLGPFRTLGIACAIVVTLLGYGVVGAINQAADPSPTTASTSAPAVPAPALYPEAPAPASGRMIEVPAQAPNGYASMTVDEAADAAAAAANAAQYPNARVPVSPAPVPALAEPRYQRDPAAARPVTGGAEWANERALTAREQLQAYERESRARMEALEQAREQKAQMWYRGTPSDPAKVIPDATSEQ